MRVTRVKLETLETKHYSTNVTVWLDGDGWTTDGTPFSISISGYGKKPSDRELEKGYDVYEGMNHVESEEHLAIARAILQQLNGLEL